MATTANWLEQWLSERGLFGRTQEQEPASSFQPMPMPYKQTGPLRFAQMPTESGEDFSSSMLPVSSMPPGITQEEARRQLQSISGGALSIVQDLKNIVREEQRKADIDNLLAYLFPEEEKTTAPTKGLFPDFDLDLGTIGEKISQGAKNIFESLDAPKPGDPITMMNAGPFGMMGRALSDPTLDTASKVGASIVGLGSMATSAFTPVSMLGTALNAMGAYHTFDPEFDKDITIDLDSGRVQWSGTDTPVSNPEDVARQTGGLAYYDTEARNNFIQSVAAKSPNELITIDGREFLAKDLAGRPAFQPINEPFDLSKMFETGIDNASKELKGLFEGFGDSGWGQIGMPGIVSDTYWNPGGDSHGNKVATEIAGYANIPGNFFSRAVDAFGREVADSTGGVRLGFGNTKRGQLLYDQKIRDEALDRGPHQKGAGQTVVTIKDDGWTNVDTGDALGSGDDIGNVTDETSGDVAGI